MNRNLDLKVISLLTVFALSACGGGSGENDTAIGDAFTNPNTEPDPYAPDTPDTPVVPTITVSPPPEYRPEPERLEVEAQDSREIYVEPDFDFDLTQPVRFYITANDDIGYPIRNLLIKIYSVPALTENWDDLIESDKELLFIAKTDDNGLFEATEELSPKTTKVLAVAATIGISNKALLDIAYNSASHHF